MEGKREFVMFLDKVSRDRTLRDDFLKDPEKIAKEHGVAMTKGQIARVNATAEFVNQIGEMLNPCRFDPEVCYPPLDDLMIRWRVGEVVEAMRWVGPIFYPIPWWFRQPPIIYPPIIYPPRYPIGYPIRYWGRGTR